MLRKKLEELPSIEYTSNEPYVVHENADKLTKLSPIELENIDDDVHYEYASALTLSAAQGCIRVDPLKILRIRLNDFESKVKKIYRKLALHASDLTASIDLSVLQERLTNMINLG
ncbi:Uncharacterized protein Fot_06909 [Forsythia ovata]|uniref:Uncharacterized protein n=1 Tax=Forsythia ovata TaxID=205694 RepID=A0ABD1WUB2_9LAMI